MNLLYKKFIKNITLSSNQIEDGRTKYKGVCDCLVKAFFNRGLQDNDKLVFGSFKNNTQVLPMGENQESLIAETKTQKGEVQSTAGMGKFLFGVVNKNDEKAIHLQNIYHSIIVKPQNMLCEICLLVIFLKCHILYQCTTVA